MRLVPIMMLAVFAGPLQALEIPKDVTRQLPPGYTVLSTAKAVLGDKVGPFYFVVLARHRENGASGAPARPLLIFARQSNGAFQQVGRNDHVVLRADEGGQCDPFLDGGGVIAVKGRYVTVENGVACGQHWTDYVTFRFEPAAGQFVFDNERSESWSLNSSSDPAAEALVEDGPPKVRRSDRRHPIAFTDWRRAR